MAADRDIWLKVNQEECQALADLLHDRKQIRMNPDETWTALKLMDLRAHVDAELVLSKATPFIEVPTKKKSS